MSTKQKRSEQKSGTTRKHTKKYTKPDHNHKSPGRVNMKHGRGTISSVNIELTPFYYGRRVKTITIEFDEPDYTVENHGFAGVVDTSEVEELAFWAGDVGDFLYAVGARDEIDEVLTVVPEIKESLIETVVVEEYSTPDDWSL